MAKAFSLLLAILCHIVLADRPLPSATVQCETTKGDIKIEVYRDWAPLGADRFLELVRDNYYTDIGFYRCVKRFLTQFGISDNPEKKHWTWKQIKDDPNLHLGIKKNYVSFAGGGANTRTTQIFIAFEDLDFLGKEPWETPFGVVVEGQSTLDALYKGYGDIPPFGKGPDQLKVFSKGNAYLRENFPELDYLKSCHVVGEEHQQLDSQGKEKEAGDKGVGIVAAAALGDAQKTKPPQLQIKDKVPAATAAGNLRRVGENLSTKPPEVHDRSNDREPVAAATIQQTKHDKALDDNKLVRAENRAPAVIDGVPSNGGKQQQQQPQKSENSEVRNDYESVSPKEEKGGEGHEDQDHTHDVVSFIPPNRVLPRRNLVVTDPGDSSSEGSYAKRQKSPVKVAFAAVGFLSFALTVLYCMQRQQAAIVASSKKS